MKAELSQRQTRKLDLRSVNGFEQTYRPVKGVEKVIGTLPREKVLLQIDHSSKENNLPVGKLELTSLRTTSVKTDIHAGSDNPNCESKGSDDFICCTSPASIQNPGSVPCACPK